MRGPSTPQRSHRWPTWVHPSRGLSIEPSRHQRKGFRIEGPPVPTSLLLADLRQLADDLGRPPTREEFDEFSDMSRFALEKRIGWENALERAGVTCPDGD